VSRILFVLDDARTVPWEACWWRLRLRRNVDGNVAITQVYIPEGRTLEDFEPWAGHTDYFDGRNDWSWPYKAQTSFDEPKFDGPWIDCDRTIAIRPGSYYLDVLDTVPPDVSDTSRWTQLTRPGIHIHPGRRVDDYSYPWPRARRDWIFQSELTDYETAFLMG
jgi:hypothetical protein